MHMSLAVADTEMKRMMNLMIKRKAKVKNILKYINSKLIKKMKIMKTLKDMSLIK